MSESILSPRKRRRPALSCVECRRRKIKCDRNEPCTQCIQSKNSTCRYKDGNSYPAAPKTAEAKSSAKSSASPLSSDQLGAHGFVHFDPEVLSSDHDGRLSRSVSMIAPVFGESHSNSTTLYTPSADSPEEPKPDQSVQILSERLSKLEKNLTTVSSRNSDPLWTSFSSLDKPGFFGQATTVPVPELRGSVSKTRLYGQSHWMSAFVQFKEVSNFRSDTDINPVHHFRHAIQTCEIRNLLEKCKNMARVAKAEHPNQWEANPSLRGRVPSRETSDKLVHLYLRTCESTYRILHIPTFEKEYRDYWNDPQSASSGFLVKLLLVMAIGTIFYQETDFYTIRASAQQWVYAAQSWMASPFEKGRLNLTGLQIHCLIIIARQTTGVGGDLVWISVGSLVRMAITMGFHREPRLFPRMTVLHSELRRRLWASVVEMAVMSSFDYGTPPLISLGDWDTEPPANINDDEIDETTTEPPVSKPNEVYTQTSLQIQLLKSLRTRLEISRLLSDFRFEPAYDDVIRLGKEILSYGREGLLLAQSVPEGAPNPTILQRNLLDTPIRRVLLALHCPFAMRARTNPRFYYSRKVCLDAAIAILSYPSTSSPTTQHPLVGEHDDYTRLKLVGAGFIKELLIYASVFIQLELITQLEEESPLMRSEVGRSTREPLKQALAYTVEICAERIRLGENNIKGHLFLSTVSAQIDALERDVDPDPLIAKAAKESAETCSGLLTARIKKPPSSVVMDDMIAGNDGNVNAYGNGLMDVGNMETDQNFAFEYLMPDASVNFDMPESWLFEGWEEQNEW